ncbi:MAG: hypothetical protein K0V04_07685 [Deltaproteobacteria bacterium]|nr:hypothetical protein [Deltaproteobacteria bacterium]
MKIKTVKPEKYQDLSKGELKEQLMKRDVSDVRQSVEDQQQQGRLTRMGAAAAASVLTGLLYEKKPSLESIMGSPVSLDHLAALGGAVGAFMVDDDQVADALEGLAQAGMVPLLRGMGRKVGGMSLA